MDGKTSRSRFVRLLLAATTTVAVAAGTALVAPAASAAEAVAQPSGPYQSCDDAVAANPSGLLTIKRIDYYKPGEWKKRNAFNITAELYPPLNAPGWGTQTQGVRVYVNGKATQTNIGRTKPTSDIQHGRFNAWEFKYAGDAPWTKHAVRGGDIISLMWAARLVGAKGESGGVSGWLSCRA